MLVRSSMLQRRVYPEGRVMIRVLRYRKGRLTENPIGQIVTSRSAPNGRCSRPKPLRGSDRETVTEEAKMEDHPMTWTKGPWRLQYMNGRGYGGCIYAIETDAGTVAGTETEANARLIAAAPEMADLIVELSASLRKAFPGGDTPDHAERVWTKARTLLARIQGE